NIIKYLSPCVRIFLTAGPLGAPCVTSVPHTSKAASIGGFHPPISLLIRRSLPKCSRIFLCTSIVLKKKGVVTDEGKTGYCYGACTMALRGVRGRHARPVPPIHSHWPRLDGRQTTVQTLVHGQCRSYGHLVGHPRLCGGCHCCAWGLFLRTGAWRLGQADFPRRPSGGGGY